MKGIIMISRRIFLASLPAAGALALGAKQASAAVANITETDPAAAALGYKGDATKVDIKKFPNYVKGQQCAGCQLYVGKPTDAAAPCGVFGGKLVAGKGWCAAWSKKA
jgi:hypothetical protein